VDWSNDIAYAGDWPQTPGQAAGRRQYVQSGFPFTTGEKTNCFDGMTIGLNYMNFIVEDDI